MTSTSGNPAGDRKCQTHAFQPCKKITATISESRVMARFTDIRDRVHHYKWVIFEFSFQGGIKKNLSHCNK